MAPGDKVWLIYSDSERARYIRKHGHGQPWKHAYVVKAVKPHAVLLDIPTDGSVPDVLEWQSLRKCSKAPPAFHADAMPTPTVDLQGRTVLPEEDGLPPSEAAPDDPSTPDGPGMTGDWSGWTPDRVYEIDRITSACPVGSGWRVMVKWKGYDEATPEKLSHILKETQNPDILKQIEECKQRYWDEHPRDRHLAPPDTGAGPQPSGPAADRPRRERSKVDRFQFALFAGDSHTGHSCDPSTVFATTAALRDLRHYSEHRVQALQQYHAHLDDPWELSSTYFVGPKSYILNVQYPVGAE